MTLREAVTVNKINHAISQVITVVNQLQLFDDVERDIDRNGSSE